MMLAPAAARRCSPLTPLSAIQSAFRTHFGRPADVVSSAPGRVNLIGEHTDYNDGFVLPLALEHATWCAVARRDDGQTRVYSRERDESQEWPSAGWRDAQRPHWTSYIGGVAELLTADGARLDGFDAYIASDVPVGAGLSSSAALELSVAAALAALAGFDRTPTQLADIAHQAEHQFAGTPCGIMDQFIAALAQADTALLLDCRSREIEHIPLALHEHAVVVVDSGVKHELASGEYAVRRQQCEAAVEVLQAAAPSITSLRDVTPELLADHGAKLDEVVLRRARHVITENARTLAAADALRRADLPALGPLMAASHASLRTDYEVSCPELDALVDLLAPMPGVVGVRMTGGGFGGSVVAIAQPDAVTAIAEALPLRYEAHWGHTARVITTRPGAGVRVVHPSAESAA